MTGRRVVPRCVICGALLLPRRAKIVRGKLQLLMDWWGHRYCIRTSHGAVCGACYDRFPIYCELEFIPSKQGGRPHGQADGDCPRPSAPARAGRPTRHTAGGGEHMPRRREEAQQHPQTTEARSVPNPKNGRRKGKKRKEKAKR